MGTATLDLWAELRNNRTDNQSGDVAQSANSLQSYFTQVASDKIKAIDSSTAAPNTAEAERQVASDIQTVSLDEPQPKPQQMSSQAIRDLLFR